MKKKAPAKKFYTIHEANAALPLVRAIVSDIVALAAEMRRHYARIEQVRREDADVVLDDSDDADEALQALREGKEKMTSYVRELHRLGIELKDFHTGLIDFRSMLDGREVYLCWRHGESDVAYWHELDAGFAGRQKLSRTGMPPALAKGAN